jgi:hypothetical protein
MYSIARAGESGEKGENVDQCLNITCLVSIDQFVETVACVTQLEEHVGIFDVIAYLVFNNPSTIDKS